MGKAVYDPEKYCPICGRRSHAGSLCDERTLRGIDAAHRRDPDSEELRADPPPFARLAEWNRYTRV